jgi:hypothetical protein
MWWLSHRDFEAKFWGCCGSVWEGSGSVWGGSGSVWGGGGSLKGAWWLSFGDVVAQSWKCFDSVGAFAAQFRDAVAQSEDGENQVRDVV